MSPRNKLISVAKIINLIYFKAILTVYMCVCAYIYVYIFFFQNLPWLHYNNGTSVLFFHASPFDVRSLSPIVPNSVIALGEEDPGPSLYFEFFQVGIAPACSVSAV